MLLELKCVGLVPAGLCNIQDTFSVEFHVFFKPCDIGCKLRSVGNLFNFIAVDELCCYLGEHFLGNDRSLDEGLEHGYIRC